MTNTAQAQSQSDLNDSKLLTLTEAEPRTARSRALDNEMKQFCQSFRLTPRESEIVAVLAEGVTRIKDIAVRLKLSPNTVNNHVNSIFMKTKARSKSQLLAMLLNRIAEELQTARFFRHSPRVILMTQNRDLLVQLHGPLSSAGFDVRIATSSDIFARESQESRPHFVIADLGFPDLDAKKFCENGGLRVLYIGANSVVTSRCEAMNLGAIDLFESRVDPTQIVNVLLSHYIESDVDRARFANARPANAKPARELLTLSPRRIGRGGLYLSNTDVARAFGEPLAVGDRIQMNISVDGLGKPMTAECEVVWVKPDPGTTNTGTGVRLLHFKNATKEDHQSWQDLLRRNSARAYIPMGEMPS